MLALVLRHLNASFVNWFGQSAVTLAILASAAISAPAQPFFLTSNSNTLAAVQDDLNALDSGNLSGLAFQPVLVGDFNTKTPVPPRSPAGTEVVQIPPADGENGFFLLTFSLPPEVGEMQLVGAANADDLGRVFLNGHPVTPSLTNGDPATVSEFSNVVFAVTNPAWFNPGTNQLILSDWNSGGGPSGAAFFAIVFARPALTIQVTHSDATVSWRSVSNLIYQLQYSSNVTAGAWHNLGTTLDGSNSTIGLKEPLVPGSSPRLYRLQVR